MRCDDYCPRCGEPEESVTHAIFECPPTLQAWSLSDIPSRPGMFPLSSIYANMNYLLWRKNKFDGVEQDRDPYPWIIWYIWKARNDKLFKGTDRDPLKLVRFAESECKAWFDANEQMAINSQDNNMDEPQVIRLENICMVDGSWSATAMFSGCGWIWKDSGGRTQLMGMRNLIRKESALHSEVKALRWAMESMVQYSPCQHFGSNCKDLIALVTEPKKWPRFAMELEEIKTLELCFPDFELSHIPRTQNGCSDSLAKGARSFHRSLCYVGYSIPVWLPRPPQA